MLIYGLIIVGMVSILLSSIVRFVGSQLQYSFRIYSNEESIQIAEAGVHYYHWYLAHMTAGKTPQQINAFWQGGTALGVASDYEAEYDDPSGTVSGRYRIHVTTPESGSTIVMVRATGWTSKYPNSTRTIQVRFRRPSWSEYSVLSNADVWFGDTETVVGKVFTNGGIRMDGYATNTVSSAVNTYQDASAGATSPKPGVWSNQPNEFNPVYNVPVFQGGKRYPVTAKDFNSVGADLSFMKSEAQAGTNGSLYFNNAGLGRHIKLQANGTFQIRTVSAYSTTNGYNAIQWANIPNQVTGYSDNWQTFTLPSDGLIFVENNVWLEGTINNRKLTVVAANLLGGAQASVYFGMANIQYTNYDGRDSLGIVAQWNIESIYNSLNTIRVDGALLAQNGRVLRSYYGPGDVKTIIRTYGALATNQQYTWSWCYNYPTCAPLAGYPQSQSEYDNNLYYFPPPYFPSGTQYSMDLWEEE